MASSRTRVLTALSHQQPDRIPVDFGSTMVTGVHVRCVAALRDYYGLRREPVKAIDPGQMLGEIDQDLAQVMRLDVEGIFRPSSRFGHPLRDWQPWRMPDGLEILVPGEFNVSVDRNGDLLVHPGGDLSASPSARMPAGGYFFDAIIRQQPIEEDRLAPHDNLEEFTLLGADDLDHFEREAERARAGGRAVMANFGGTSFGDVAHVPGVGLKNPRGIRDVTEWYISLATRREYVRRVFEGQCEMALLNLEKLKSRLGDAVDVVMICGTDFGTQSSSFCSVETFRDIWMPFYKQVNDWIHRHTSWKTMKHSCGAVEQFIPSFIESGFDILNPVQCSAAGMDPRKLKSKYGDRIVFWGGGVDTQRVLPFGTPAQVREQVLRRCEIFAAGGGFVFNTVHNIQADTPVANVVAMFEALSELNG